MGKKERKEKEKRTEKKRNDWISCEEKELRIENSINLSSFSH
jgi:hypothetical protein